MNDATGIRLRQQLEEEGRRLRATEVQRAVTSLLPGILHQDGEGRCWTTWLDSGTTTTRFPQDVSRAASIVDRYRSGQTLRPAERRAAEAGIRGLEGEDPETQRLRDIDRVLRALRGEGRLDSSGCWTRAVELVASVSPEALWRLVALLWPLVAALLVAYGVEVGL